MIFASELKIARSSLATLVTFAVMSMTMLAVSPAQASNASSQAQSMSQVTPSAMTTSAAGTTTANAAGTTTTNAAAPATTVANLSNNNSRENSSSSKPTAVAGVTSATVSYKSAGSGMTYRVRYAPSPYKTWVTYGTTTTSLSLLVTPLTAGVSYVFQVSSKKTTGNSNSWGNWSANSNVVIPTAPTVVTYSIVATVGAGGAISPGGTSSVISGGSQSYSITPLPNYHVASVLIDGTSVGAITSYSFTNVTANHTIAVTFAIDTHNITAGVDYGSGTITPSGVTAVNHGASQTYTISPATGWVLNDIYVDSVKVSNASTYTFSNVTANHTILVSFKLDSYTINAAVDFGNGSISPLGNTTVSAGGSQTYTITPDAGWQINELYVDSVKVTKASTYTFSNVTANHTILVSFSHVTYTINASVDFGSGTISPSGTTTLNSGDSQSYAFTPALGWYITDVVVDGASVGAVTSYEFTNIAANHTIYVSFALHTYTITASSTSANVQVSPSGDTTVDFDGSQIYYFDTDNGYHITDVVVDGASQGVIYSYEFTGVRANHTIVVKGAINTYSIVSSVTGSNGSISSAGTSTVEQFASKTYDFTPATGYRVADVLVDGVSQGAITSYTFTDIGADHTISVSFELDAYTILTDIDNAGSIDQGSSVSVSAGTDKTFTFTLQPHIHVKAIYVDDVLVVGTGTSYTFTNVSANHTLFVALEYDPSYTITASVASGNGSITDEGETTVYEGASITYSFTPGLGSHVSNVWIDTVSVGAPSSYTFTNVQDAHSISVAFALDTFTITSSSNSTHGQVTPDGVSSVDYDGSKTFVFDTDNGYHITEVTVDGVSQGVIFEYTFSHVTENHTISVSVAINTYSIVSSVTGSNGSISSAGTSTVEQFSSKTYDFTPAAGYRVADVLVDGVSQGALASYTFTDIGADHTISVAFEAAPPAGPSYTITSYVRSGSGGLGYEGDTQVAEGSDKTYYFEPGSWDWRVKDVVVDGVSQGVLSSYTFSNVSADHTIYVVFETKKVWLYSDVFSGNGSIDPVGDVQVWRGDDATFNFTPDDGWFVSAIYVDGVNVGGADSYTLTDVQGYTEIYVEFSEITTFNITASLDSSHGSISDEGTRAFNATADWTYSFSAADGYHISDVVVDGHSVGAVETYTFHWIAKSHTIVVFFEADPAPPATNYTITYDSNASQSGTSSTSQKQVDHDSVTIQDNTYSAANGAHFFGWNTAASGLGTYYYPGDSYDLQADVKLYAIWTYNITINVGTLVAGPFSSTWAKINFPDPASPNTNVALSLEPNSSQTIKVLAGAMWPYQLFMTDQWQSIGDVYTGGYFVTLTNLNSWDSRIYMPASFDDGGNRLLATYVAISPAGADGSISIDYVDPSTMSYQITYDSNYPQSLLDSTAHTQSGTGYVQLDGNDYVSNNGATFYGWNTAYDGSGTYYMPGDIVRLQGEITLYAIWYFDATITVGALDYGASYDQFVEYKFAQVGDTAPPVLKTAYSGDVINLKLMACMPGALPCYNGLLQWTGNGSWDENTGRYNGQYSLDVVNASQSWTLFSSQLSDGNTGLATRIWNPTGSVSIFLNWWGA